MKSGVCWNVCSQAPWCCLTRQRQLSEHFIAVVLLIGWGTDWTNKQVFPEKRSSLRTPPDSTCWRLVSLQTDPWWICTIQSRVSGSNSTTRFSFYFERLLLLPPQIWRVCACGWRVCACCACVLRPMMDWIEAVTTPTRSSITIMWCPPATQPQVRSTLMFICIWMMSANSYLTVYKTNLYFFKQTSDPDYFSN